MTQDQETDFTEELALKYPNLFREGSLRCGFSIGPGWHPLVNKLCLLIENHLERDVPEELRSQIFAEQFKEKFGKLRCYLSHETPYISGLIAMAETISGTICEDCGNHGKIVGRGYIRTLCDDCASKCASK